MLPHRRCLVVLRHGSGNALIRSVVPSLQLKRQQLATKQIQSRGRSANTVPPFALPVTPAAAFAAAAALAAAAMAAAAAAAAAGPVAATPPPPPPPPPPARGFGAIFQR